MRTVKRQTICLNKQKQREIKKLCIAYAKEKRYWLDLLKGWDFQSELGCPHSIRNRFVKESYQSRYGLQARHWKLALQDAVEVWDKYWKALFVKLRSKIARSSFNDQEKHYAYFLLKGYQQFAALMKGDIPQAPFELEKKSSKKVSDYLRRIIKKLKGKSPTIKKERLVKFDANCYRFFEHRGREYLSLMSKERGKRLTLPLEGKSKVKGNIALVLSQEAIEIHISQQIREKRKLFGPIEAVDFGYTEVMTDREGVPYGKQFGDILTKRSNDLHEKMQKRHKLHTAERKNPSSKKACHIRKNNLGKKKLIQKQQKTKASLLCEINRAINQLIKTKQPSLLITEDLSHLFTYKKSKSVNRKLSSWLRGEIQNRVSFKALAEGFRHEMVNPAYGSQICPKCDFVDHKNRINDKFKCLFCRHEDMADRVAAENYARRYGDHQIERYTPYREVKTILLDRFHRRLETEQSVTVPGRGRETISGMYPPYPVEIMNIIAGRESSRQNRVVNPTAKQNKHV